MDFIEGFIELATHLGWPVAFLVLFLVLFRKRVGDAVSKILDAVLQRSTEERERRQRQEDMERQEDREHQAKIEELYERLIDQQQGLHDVIDQNTQAFSQVTGVLDRNTEVLSQLKKAFQEELPPLTTAVRDLSTRVDRLENRIASN